MMAGKKPKKAKQKRPKKAKAPAKIGRPTKLDQALHDTIIKLVRQGNYIETAAASAGVAKKTIYDWLNRAHDELERVAKNPLCRVRLDEAPFVNFLHAFKKAQADWEHEATGLIQRAGMEREVVKTKVVQVIEGDVVVSCTTTTSREVQIDWPALAWRLERTRPDRYGRRQPIAAEKEAVQRVEVVVIDQFEDEDDDDERTNKD